jgi:hypothetical protein
MKNDNREKQHNKNFSGRDVELKCAREFKIVTKNSLFTYFVRLFVVFIFDVIHFVDIKLNFFQSQFIQTQLNHSVVNLRVKQFLHKTQLLNSKSETAHDHHSNLLRFS